MKAIYLHCLLPLAVLINGDSLRRPSLDIHKDVFVDKSNWVDPDEMFDYKPKELPSYDLVVKKADDAGSQSCPVCVPKIVESCKLNQTQICHKQAHLFTQRFAQRLLRKLQEISVADGDTLTTHISSVSVLTLDLERYLVKESSCRMMDAMEDHMFALIDRLSVGNFDAYIIRFKDNLLIGCITLFLVIFVLMIYCLATLSYTAKMVYFAIYCLIAATIWHWFYLYQEKLAENHATISKLAVDCLTDPKNPYTFLEWLTSALTGPVSFRSLKDGEKCDQYYRTMFINPALSINPVTAFSETISLLLFTPFTIFGQKFGSGTREFFSHIPTGWTIFFLVAAVVVIVYGIRALVEFSTQRSPAPHKKVEKFYMFGSDPEILEQKLPKFMRGRARESIKHRRPRSHSLADLR